MLKTVTVADCRRPLIADYIMIVSAHILSNGLDRHINDDSLIPPLA